MELRVAEVSIFMGVSCWHLFMEATMYVDDASHNNNILHKILPALNTDYVLLVNAHTAEVAIYKFVSQRQLLLLSIRLDLPDVLNREVASVFLQTLPHKTFDHYLEKINEDELSFGDGSILGGGRNCAALADLCNRVPIASIEFKVVVVNVIKEVGHTLHFIPEKHQACLLAKESLSIRHNKSEHPGVETDLSFNLGRTEERVTENILLDMMDSKPMEVFYHEDGEWSCATLRFDGDKGVHVFDQGAFDVRVHSKSSVAIFMVLITASGMLHIANLVSGWIVASVSTQAALNGVHNSSRLTCVNNWFW